MGDIASLTQAIADLDAAMATAADLRNNEKAKNIETIADSKEAQTAVAQALAVLKDFYAKAATATFFVQGREDPTINEANDHIGVLKADIEKAVATIEKLSEEIAELEEDVSIWEGDIKAATKMGEIENADYDKTHADSPNPSMRVSCVISSSFRCRSRVCRFTM